MPVVEPKFDKLISARLTKFYKKAVDTLIPIISLICRIRRMETAQKGHFLEISRKIVLF